MSISQDRLRYLLTYEKETGMFTWNIKSRNGLLKSGTIAGGKDAYGYRKIHIDGVTKPLAEWAEVIGISPITLSTRWKRGWTDQQILKTPVQKRGGPYERAR